MGHLFSESSDAAFGPSGEDDRVLRRYSAGRRWRVQLALLPARDRSAQYGARQRHPRQDPNQAPARGGGDAHQCQIASDVLAQITRPDAGSAANAAPPAAITIMPPSPKPTPSAHTASP